ncbi:DUF1688 family protein, partial [Acinetobacter baumannii]
ELSDGLQVSRSNTLVGLEERLPAINRLGQYIAFEPEMFSTDTGVRPGGLVDYVTRLGHGSISASHLMQLVLKPLLAAAPGPYALGGVALGDSW